MSSVYSLPDEGDENPATGQPKSIRLGNVIEIAAGRLDGASEGAPKEGLAPPGDPSRAPDHAQEPLTADRVEPTSSELIAKPPAPLMQTQSEVASGEPQPIALSRDAETAEAFTAISASTNRPVAGEAAVKAGSGERDIRSQELAVNTAADGTHATFIALDAVASETHEAEAPIGGAEDADLSSTGRDAGAGALAHASLSSPGAGAEQTHDSADASERAPEATGLEVSPPSAAPAADVAIPSIGTTAPPFAKALGTAAKLAADATAAAEALENLKRLLERQLPNPAQVPRQSLHEVFAQAPSPPPLPTHELREETQNDELQAPVERPAPRPGARNPGWRERRQFDFRGFMAGFALSWAIGAALYIYLTAG